MRDRDHLPLSRPEALASGIDDATLTGPRFRRVLVGHYVPAEVPHETWHAIRAALRCHPSDAVATHYSAARLYGAPVPDHPDVHVTVRRAADRRRRLGVRCHALAIAEDDVVRMRGLRVSTPERLFLEMARCLTLLELVVLGDWLVQQRHTSVPVLRAYCARSTEQHRGRAVRAASYVRAGSESPRESMLRLLLVLAGVPSPAVNHEVFVDGRFLARLDLALVGWKVAIEYDGAHHADRAQWEADVLRRQRLEHEGWRVIVVTARQLFGDPEGVLRRVVAALRDRGLDVGPLNDDWRVHFAR